MSNRKKLEDANILKKDGTYTAEEDAALDSLTDEEVDAVVNRTDTLTNVVNSHAPTLAGPGTHHLVDHPDEEPGEG